MFLKRSEEFLAHAFGISQGLESARKGNIKDGILVGLTSFLAPASTREYKNQERFVDSSDQDTRSNAWYLVNQAETIDFILRGFSAMCFVANRPFLGAGALITHNLISEALIRTRR